MFLFTHVIITIASFLSLLIIIPYVRLIALQYDIIDVPRGPLKTHALPTPYLGGLAIYLGFLPAFVATVYCDINLIFFVAGLTVLFLTGLIDDKYVISPLQKIIGQLFACFLFLKAKLCFTAFTFIPLFPSLSFYFSLKQLDFFAAMISLFWILVIVNAANLVDIMDGLLTVMSFGITLFLIILCFLKQDFAYLFLLFNFLGMLVAFFLYNKPKATIFLGDAGSLLIGGFLSTFPFLGFGWQNTAHVVDFFVPFFFYALLLNEIVSLIIIRTSKRIPFYYGSPHHFICYFKKAGWSLKKILTVTFCAINILGVTGLFVAFLVKNNILLLFSLATELIFWNLIIFL